MTSPENERLINILCYDCGKIIPKSEKEAHKQEHYSKNRPITKIIRK